MITKTEIQKILHLGSTCQCKLPQENNGHKSKQKRFISNLTMIVPMLLQDLFGLQIKNLSLIILTTKEDGHGVGKLRKVCMGSNTLQAMKMT